MYEQELLAGENVLDPDSCATQIWGVYAADTAGPTTYLRGCVRVTKLLPISPEAGQLAAVLHAYSRTPAWAILPNAASSDAI